MSRKFIILFGGRSGSSHLTSLLNGSSEIFCYPEIFGNMRAEQRRMILGAFLNDQPLAPINVYALDARFVPAGKAFPAACMGFKSKYKDLGDVGEVFRALEANGARLIYLTRNNILKQALSTITSRALHRRSGQFNALSAGMAIRSIHVDPEELKHWAVGCQASRIALKFMAERYNGPKITVVYEDLLALPDRELSRITEFLGVAPFPACSTFTKNTADDLREAISNLDEVQASIRGTWLAPYLLKDDPPEDY